MDGARQVPRGDAVYTEFERLYRLARTLRPTSTDRWNGDLFEGSSEDWGSIDRHSGAITLSTQHVLRHLRGSDFPSSAYEQAQALATVLHESTHAGMELDATESPNAVRMKLSWNVMEGVAEVRAIEDFRAFADLTGYSGLPVPKPQYPAPYAAIDKLIDQASGPRKGDGALLDDLSRGPGVLHLDCLADGVLQNRLADVVPLGDQQAVRAALIKPMLHPSWSEITTMEASTGEGMARDIQIRLDPVVEQIRSIYTADRPRPASGDALNPPAREHDDGSSTPDQQAATPVRGGWTPSVGGRTAVPAARFLDGMTPAAGATAELPSLGQGARGAGRPFSRPGRIAERGQD